MTAVRWDWNLGGFRLHSIAPLKDFKSLVVQQEHPPSAPKPTSTSLRCMVEGIIIVVRVRLQELQSQAPYRIESLKVFDSAPLYTHTFGLGQIQQAFQMCSTYSDGVVKMVFDFEA